MVHIPYRSVNYSISMQELQDFLSNKSIYGGHLYVDTGIDRYGKHKIIVNHGAFVARKGGEFPRTVSKLLNKM